MTTGLERLNDYALYRYLRGEAGELMRRLALEEVERRAAEAARDAARHTGWCVECGRAVYDGGLLCRFHRPQAQGGKP